MDKYEKFRQFISPFLHGKPNAEAILQTLADEIDRQEKLSIAVTDQLTISTATGIYLDKRLSELGITRPPELGMDDLAFRNMGIQLNAQKQITESIHTILSTFFGDETTRASTTSGNYEPFFFEPNDDLIFKIDSEEELTLTVQESDFVDIQNVTARELASVITRFIRGRGINGYAQEYLDTDTGKKYVKIFSGAKGPYGMVQIIGGRMQNELEFPLLRATELPSNTTVWEITRNAGSTHRFRWVSGPKPLLEKVFIGDAVMIYGNNFASYQIEGTFKVKNVRPASSAPAVNAGWFEIDIEGLSILNSSEPDQNPPPNTPTETYSITVTQSSYNDLKFFLQKKNTSYSQVRYALAFEPADSLLKVYIPATTKVVRRDLIGSAHIHMLYPSNDLNGVFGSATDVDKKIQIMSDRSIRYKQKGADNLGFGGTLKYGSNTIDIDYVQRENGYTQVYTLTPHGIPSLPPDQWGRVFSNTIVTINVNNVMSDDPVNQFNGAYLLDPESNYTLSDKIVYLREKITKNDRKNLITISGTLPNKEGYLLFNLCKDNQENPVKYLSCQTINTILPVNIVSISQNGTVVTVTTDQPHQSIPNESISISGTLNFNGTWVVQEVPSPNTLIFYKTPPLVVSETTGQLIAIINGSISTVTLDPSYEFKNSHDINSDISLLSDTKPYEPVPDGSDYGLYITGTADGRIFVENLMKEIVALGIKMEIIVIYPSDKGLGNEGGSSSYDIRPTSEKVFVWGS